MAVTKSNNFIEHSIIGALSFLKESVFSDECASQKGFLQSIDPRIKAAGFAIFILAVLFTKSIIAAMSLYIVCLALAYFSKVSLIFFLKRTWIFIPLFSVFIAIPALFSIFTPGEALVSFRMLGITLTITRQGLSGASLFCARVITSVSFAVLLSMTTKHFDLLKVLRVFRVPQVFVMILGMCYRYIYLFTEIVENTYLAIKSRVGREVHHKRGRRIVAWSIASLWYRSYQLNEAVYSAMLSRGYTGEPVILHNFKSKPKDWLWLSLVLIITGALLYYGANII